MKKLISILINVLLLLQLIDNHLYPRETGLIVRDHTAHKESIWFSEHNPLPPFSRSLKEHHMVNGVLPYEFCPFECIEHYLLQAKEKGIALPREMYTDIIPDLADIKKKVTRFPQKLMPCHLDLHTGNTHYDGKGLFITDWSYTAMADPFFDLAILASERHLSEDEMAQLLKVYLEKEISNEEYNHFFIMRILADIRWSFCCYLQVTTSSTNEPYYLEATHYLKSALEKLKKYKQNGP